MKIQYGLTFLLAALHCAEGVCGKHTFQRRQDSTDLTTTARSTASPLSTDRSSENGGSSTSNDDRSQSSATPTSRTTQSSVRAVSSASATFSSIGPSLHESTTPTTAIVTTSNVAGNGLNPTSSVLPNALPIPPKITPAVGIAGVVLLVAGVLLCLVGIKHDWLYIFLSSALLTGLAATVLIMYVMNPPVSDAVQGAFLVAAVMTGLVFGSVSLIFKEVTDGLGCLLGGFCLAMWLLVLAPGGIISSTVGRGILIGLLSLACFALSFSHYMRTYALIGCTSFAGSMTTIIGVDCFSRAGLKEFWIYLWDLNRNEFPLGTKTYRITRGIRVEIACTIVLFIFGLMSQLKIWKVVKERRDKTETERLRNVENREQEEAEIGQKIAASNERDLAQWEAVYGDEDTARVHVDSGLGSSVESTQRASESFREKGVDVTELAEHRVSQAPSDAKDKSRPSVTVRVASEDRVSNDAESSREELLRSAEASRPASRRSTTRGSYVEPELHGQDHRRESFTPGTPPVQPLPFSLPQDQRNSDRESLVLETPDNRSIEGHQGQQLEYFLLTKHDKQYVNERFEDDRASSVAATADNEHDVMIPSGPVSSYDMHEQEGSMPKGSDDELDGSEEVSGGGNEDELLEEHDEEALARPMAPTVDHTSQTSEPSPQKKRRSVESSQQRSVASRRSGLRGDLNNEDGNHSISGSLVGQLPPQLSKIALTYRTNEWAKHIADADAPDPESVLEAHSPGIQIDTAFAKEAAKPVDIESLQQSGTQPEQEVRARNISQASHYPYHQSEPKPSANRTSRQSIGHVHALSGRSSQMSFQRQDSSVSNTYPTLSMSASRNNSGHLTSQPLVESPVEDTFAASSPCRNSPSYGANSNTLMDQRHNQIKQRPVMTSFNAPPSNTNLNLIAPSGASLSYQKLQDNDNISLRSLKHSPDDEENMTLAQRRELVQRQRRISNPPTPAKRPSRSRQGTYPSVQPSQEARYIGANPIAETLVYDSHQPKRTQTVDKVKQSARLSQWRQSLQGTQQASQPTSQDEDARLALLKSQRQAERVQAKLREEKDARESYMEAAMRNGQLHDAHRDALRKMQAKAREGTSG